MVIHPPLIINIFKQPRHKVVVLLINGHLAATFLGVKASHHPVQKSHNEVIVIATLAVSKHHIAFLQQIVLECLPVIDRLDVFIDSLVDICRLSHWILLLHVRHDLLLDMIVDQPYLTLCEFELIGEQDDVPQYAFRAEYFCVFVAHLVLGEGVEGRGEDE